jgi:hypothetical protein
MDKQSESTNRQHIEFGSIRDREGRVHTTVNYPDGGFGWYRDQDGKTHRLGWTGPDDRRPQWQPGDAA